MPETLGEATRLLVEAAQVEARALGHGFVGTEHLLLALLADPALAEVALKAGLPGRDALRTRLGEGGAPRGGAAKGGLSPQAKRLLESAERQAAEQGRTVPERRWILDRILATPRGPLARLIAKPPAAGGGEPAQADVPVTAPRDRQGRRDRQPKERDRPREPEPRERKERPGRKAAAQPAQAEGGGKPARAAGSAPRQATPVVIRSRPAFSVSWRAVLLLLVPAALVLNYVVRADPLVVFLVAGLGIVPLAGYMGEATEHLAARTGPAVGGLLNATFGNAAELIIAIAALQAGLVDLVKASITGSILGNLLLIMGLSFIAGGTARPVLRFSRVSAGASAGMLALAVAALAFPALFHATHPQAGALEELHLSEAVAIVLAVTYGFSLLFSLRTHRSLFGGEPHPTTGRLWSPVAAVAVLAVATAGVAVLSEILVHTVEQVTVTMGLSEVFLGLIVIPLIGNAAEHATAVVVARKGQMDLSLQIALGSSTQVALLVAPLLVGVGLLLGQEMNLVFTTFEVAALGFTTVITAIITLDGESHWFEGIQLLATYALVAAAAYFV